MVKRDGLVALEHWNTNPKTVKVADGTVYSFTPSHNVSLVWAKEEHAAELMNMRSKICCGKTKPLCFPASQINVNLWETGNKEGVLK